MFVAMTNTALAVGDYISWRTWCGDYAVVQVTAVPRDPWGTWHLTSRDGHTEYHDRLPVGWIHAAEQACTW